MATTYTKHDKCGRCGERFESLDLLFAHYADDKGTRCLTPDDLEAYGWKRWYGVWREPKDFGPSYTLPMRRSSSARSTRSNGLLKMPIK